MNKNELLDFLKRYVEQNLDNYWIQKIKNSHDPEYHIAIMKEPYLSEIYSGIKVMESRMTRNKYAPYKKAKSGDIVFLKKSGGTISGVFEVGNILFLDVESSDDLLALKRQYNDKLGLDDSFWHLKQSARYITLMEINNLVHFSNIEVNFRNRQSWIIF